MNARLLQDEMVADLTSLLQNRRYNKPDGGTAAISVFAQNLPKRQSENDDDPFPYVIVRLNNGNIENQTSPHKVSVYLLVGIYDDAMENQGHRAVLEIMEVIQQHYEETPLLSGKFVFTDPINWALQEEESYPYFFGGLEISVQLQAPRRKWSNLV